MSLTKLNSQMIELPLSVPTLSARTIQSPSIVANSANITNLSADNYYASSIFNDTDLFGNLIVHGNITSLSSFNIVSTLASTTSSLSVVNTGLGRALDITQYSNIEGVASFKGNNGEVVRINNNNPDVGYPGVAISWNGTGPSLSAQGYTNFNTVNTNIVNASNITTTDAKITNLDVTRITELRSVSATDTVTSNIILPAGGGNVINKTTFYGDINVIGRITSISAVEVTSTSTTSTSSLNIVNAGSNAAIYAKQLQSNTNGIADFVGANNTSVLKVNNTLPDIGQDAVRIIHTGVGNTFVAGNSANNNSTSFVITSAGNVGIGVNPPATALHVNGNVTASTFIGNLQGNATSVADNTVNALKLTTNAVLADKIVDNAVITSKINSQAVTTEKLALSAVTTATINNGAVTTEKLALSAVTTATINNGAVTTATINNGAVTPAKLSTGGLFWNPDGNAGVNGSLQLGSNTSEGGKLYINNQANATIGLIVDVSSSNVGRVYQTQNNSLIQIGQLVGTGGAVRFYTGATERAVIDSAGNVGIGTAAPGQKLTVSRNDGASSTADANFSNSNAFVQIHSKVSAGSWGATAQDDAAIIYSKGSIDTGSLFIGPHSASTKGIKIDASGNVGIGTITPSAKLSVIGDISSTGNINAGSINAYQTNTDLYSLTGPYNRYVSSTGSYLIQNEIYDESFDSIFNYPTYGPIFASGALNNTEIIITVCLNRYDFNTGLTAYFNGAYSTNIVVNSFTNAQGYTGYTVNGAASVNITTALGLAQATGMPATVGWATVYATRETTSANGTLYLRLRGHTTADTAQYSYTTYMAAHIDGRGNGV